MCIRGRVEWGATPTYECSESRNYSNPKGSLRQAMKMKLNKKINCSQTNDEAILSHFSGADVIIQELKYITVFAW